jgi:hypothetical protein
LSPSPCVGFCLTGGAEDSIPPTLYYAKATLAVRPPTGTDPVAFVREYLPWFPKNDPAITIKQIGATQPPGIELGFTDRDPVIAAKRANEIAKALSATLNQDPTRPPIFGISGFAEAPKEPVSARDSKK